MRLKPAVPPYEAEGLTPTHYMFVVEWLANGFNGRKAHQKYHPEASNGTADTEAWRTLRNPQVRAFIAKWCKEHLGPLQMQAEEAVGRLSLIARADIRRLFDGRGLLPIEQWPPDVALAVKSIRAGGGITLHDKLPALTKVLELTGRLKNHGQAEVDVLEEALRRDVARRPDV